MELNSQEKEIVQCLGGGEGIEKTGEGDCTMFRMFRRWKENRKERRRRLNNVQEVERELISQEKEIVLCLGGGEGIKKTGRGDEEKDGGG